MIKKIICVILCLSLLTGCGAVDRDNIINLLSSPKLSRDQSRVVDAIRDHVGADIVLKYPRRGENSRPVRMISMSGEEDSDSRVALYTAPSISTNVRVALLSGRDGEWTVTYDSEGYGSEVYSVDVTSLLPDGSARILIAYSFRDMSEKLLSVYFTDGASVSGVSTVGCQSFVIYDVTGDGIDDLILAGMNADNQRTRIRVFSSRGGDALAESGRYDLPVPNAVVTRLSLSDNDFSDWKAVLVDYRDSYHMVYTMGVYFDETGINIFLPSDTVQKLWQYPYDLTSRDVDGDGYFETATVIDSDLATGPDLKFMEWTCFLNESPVRKYYGVCNAAEGIYVPLPREWQNYVSVGFSEDGRRNVTRVSDGAVILFFRTLGTKEIAREGENIASANIGTLRVELEFDPEVSEEQRQYITRGLMSLKGEILNG